MTLKKYKKQQIVKSILIGVAISVLIITIQATRYLGVTQTSEAAVALEEQKADMQELLKVKSKLDFRMNKNKKIDALNSSLRKSFDKYKINIKELKKVYSTIFSALSKTYSILNIKVESVDGDAEYENLAKISVRVIPKKRSITNSKLRKKYNSAIVDLSIMFITAFGDELALYEKPRKLKNNIVEFTIINRGKK